MYFCILVGIIIFIVFLISGIKRMLKESVIMGVFRCIYGLFVSGLLTLALLIFSMLAGSFCVSRGAKVVYNGDSTTQELTPVAEDRYVIERPYDNNGLIEYEYSTDGKFISSIDTDCSSEVFIKYSNEEEPSITIKSYEFKNLVLRFFAIGPLKYYFVIPENSIIKTCGLP